MNIKAVMCDLDGTLLNSKITVSSSSITAIKNLRKKGILFGLCTGRAVKSVEPLLSDWGIDGLVDAIVGSGGGEIQDYTLDLFKQSYTLSGDLIREIINHFKDMDVNFAIHKDGYLVTPKENSIIQNLSKMDKTPYHVVDYNELLKEDHLKILIVCDPDTMPAVIERSKTFTNEKFKSASLQTTNLLYEYMDPRVSKSSGLESFLKLHNLTSQNLCTFGDADNDYDMTKFAGTGVVMANGSEKTKSVADFITDDNDHDGIANFINNRIL